MPLTLQPEDPRLSWQGAVSLQHGSQFVRAWRIPYADRDLFPQALLERAAMPAGVRLSFISDTEALSGQIEPWLTQSEPAPVPDPSPLDLYCDGTLQGRAKIAYADEFSFEKLPSGEKLIELWLPQFGDFRLKSLELTDNACVKPYVDERPRWITYGSSISHCARAESPSLTWPAIVARTRNLNLTCLGYGGQCHLDPMVARMIRDMAADFISIKVGINIKSANTLNERTFGPGIIGFVQIVREKHPDTPFAVISSICSPPHEEERNAVGLNLRQMREEVALAVERMRDHGDRNIHYFDGRLLLGPDDTNYLVEDQVHPSAEGYKLMARNFLERVAPTLFGPGS